MLTLLLYPMLCATFYYLGSHAVISEFIWSRYPKGFASFMRCPACMGTWVGGALGIALGWGFNLPFLGLPGRHIATPFVIALCATWWTPLFAYAQLHALLTISAWLHNDSNSESNDESNIPNNEPLSTNSRQAGFMDTRG